MLKGYGAYTQAYQKAAAHTVDQRKLILMLYDGAIKFLAQGAEHMRKGEIYEGHTHLVKGKSIIAELLASLNLEAGGEIARNLQRLYAYMFNELIDANLHRDPERVQKVVHLLKELRTAWQSIKPGAARGAAPEAQASPAAQPAPSTPQIPGTIQVKRIQVKG